MNALFLFANGKWDIMRMGGYGYVWPNIMSNYDILKSMPNYQFFLVVVVWHSLRCSNKRFQKRSSSKTEYNLWNYIEQWFVTIYLMTVSLWRTKFRISDQRMLRRIDWTRAWTTRDRREIDSRSTRDRLETSSRLLEISPRSPEISAGFARLGSLWE